MTEDTEWSDAWNEAFKGCAVRALFKPSPALTKLYCGMLGGAGAPHRGIGIHVRTGERERGAHARGSQQICDRSPLHFRCACTHSDLPLCLSCLFPGDDRTWNVELSEPKDEHYRFARCADGMRRATLEAEVNQAAAARPVDMDRWHVASDYQKVVDDVRAKYPDFVVSMEQDFEQKE